MTVISDLTLRYRCPHSIGLRTNILHCSICPDHPFYAMLVEIVVHGDILCPWCFLQKRTLEGAMERYQALHPEIEFDVTWKPFLLYPTLRKGTTITLYLPLAKLTLQRRKTCPLRKDHVPRETPSLHQPSPNSWFPPRHLVLRDRHHRSLTARPPTPHSSTADPRDIYPVRYARRFVPRAL